MRVKVRFPCRQFIPKTLQDLVEIRLKIGTRCGRKRIEGNPSTRLSVGDSAGASDQRPEDILGGDEAEGVFERQDGAAERAGG